MPYLLTIPTCLSLSLSSSSFYKYIPKVDILTPSSSCATTNNSRGDILFSETHIHLVRNTSYMTNTAITYYDSHTQCAYVANGVAIGWDPSMSDLPQWDPKQYNCLTNEVLCVIVSLYQVVRQLSKTRQATIARIKRASK